MLGEGGKGVREPPSRCREGARGSPPRDRRPQGAKERYRAGGVLPRVAPRPGVPELRGSLRCSFHPALSLHASTFQLNFPKLPKALFACKGLRSKMLTHCLLSELNISLFSSHLKEVLEQYSKTVQTNKTFPFARERNPVYSIRGHILRSL